MYKAQLRAQSFAETVSMSSSAMPHGDHGAARPLIVGSMLRDNKEEAGAEKRPGEQKKE